MTNKQVLKRACGECQLCCQLVEIPQLSKPLWTKCTHQCVTGCAVHNTATQPDVCKQFECAWLEGHGDLADRPDTTGVVVRMVTRMVKGTPTRIWAVFVGKWTDAGRKVIAGLSPELPVILHQKRRKRRVRLPWAEDFEDIPEEN